MSQATAITSGWILLEPEDVLMFRDSRPFSAGDDHYAVGSFPPLPASVTGAIRSGLLLQALNGAGSSFKVYNQSKRGQNTQLDGIREHLGDHETAGQFRLRGPMVCSYTPGGGRLMPLFPLPADLVGDDPPWIVDAPQGSERSTLAGGPFGLFRAQQLAERLNKKKKEDGGWLSLHSLSVYLRGNLSAVKRHETPVTVLEARTGISRQISTGTVEQGMLYMAQVQRPRVNEKEATGLLAHVQLPQGAALPTGYMPLGGEARSVFVTHPDQVTQQAIAGLMPTGDRKDLSDAIRADPNRRPDQREYVKIARRIVETGGRFRLYVATPAVLTNGWRPCLFDSPGGWKLELKAAAVGKPIPVAGWDLAKHGPKALRKAVPAGSVYHACLVNEDGSKIAAAELQEAVAWLMEELHFTTRLQGAEGDLYRAHCGFGVTLVGAATSPP